MKKTAVFRKASTVLALPYRDIGLITRMDALEFLRGLRDEVADVVFLDPPFNLGKHYGPLSAIEVRDPDSYEWYLRSVLRQSVRVLRPGGALFLYHLPYWAIRLGSAIPDALQFRHWIAISMKNGFARGRRLYPAHYALLYYTKGEPRRFYRPKLKPIKCPHCQEVIKDYGGYRAIINQKGLNLSDVWDDLSPVRHEAKKLRAANQLPEAITNRVCAIAGGPGAVLLDPFAGTGTSLVSAVNTGMHFVGNDIERKCIAICIKRLASIALKVKSHQRMGI